MQPVKEETTINGRLFGLLSSLLEDGTMIPKMYQPIILNFVKPYLQKTPADELRNHILTLRDKIIPFILGE